MDIPTMALIVQTFGVVGTLTAATIAVRSYVNSNKRAEEARKKEQETQELALKTQQQNLETRQAQMFMNIYDKASTLEFNLSWQKFTNAKFSTWNEFSKLYKEDKDFLEAYWATCMFYEGLGVLVKEGFLPIRMVALLMSGMTKSYWEKIMPVYEEGLKEMGFSRWLSESYYLYSELIKYLNEHSELNTRIEKILPIAP